MGILEEFGLDLKDLLKILIMFFLGIILITSLFFVLKYETNPIYQQNISYPIVLKKIVREKNKITYKLKFEIENSFIFNNKDIYITKEEYDLLKKGDKIPFIVNTGTKSIRLDEEKFNQLIEMRRLKKEGFQWKIILQ